MGVKRETTKVTFYASLMKVVAEHHLKDLFQRMCARSFQVSSTSHRLSFFIFLNHRFFIFHSNNHFLSLICFLFSPLFFFFFFFFLGVCKVLRMHSCLLHQLFVGCIPAGMPELTDVEDAQYLADHLHVSLSDKEASKLLLVSACLRACCCVEVNADLFRHSFVSSSYVCA